MSGQPILINVILDKSGSMGPKQTDVIGGFNRFIEEQRTVPGRARMIVTQFNSEVTPPTPAVPIEEVLPLTSDTYTPGGNGALRCDRPDRRACRRREATKRTRPLPDHHRRRGELVAGDDARAGEGGHQRARGAGRLDLCVSRCGAGPMDERHRNVVGKRGDVPHG
jgi:hypothetical protein